MTFNISFQGQSINLLPEPNTLEMRAMIEESGKILLIHRIKAGLTLVVSFLYLSLKDDDTFKESLSATNPTSSQLIDQLIFHKLQDIYNDPSLRQKYAELLRTEGSARKKNPNEFILNLSPVAPNPDDLPDQAIADLIQSVILDDLPGILKLLRS